MGRKKLARKQKNGRTNTTMSSRLYLMYGLKKSSTMRSRFRENIMQRVCKSIIAKKKEVSEQRGAKSDWLANKWPSNGH